MRLASDMRNTRHQENIQCVVVRNLRDENQDLLDLFNIMYRNWPIVNTSVIVAERLRR